MLRTVRPSFVRIAVPLSSVLVDVRCVSVYGVYVGACYFLE
jgi:hypothetical protein